MKNFFKLFITILMPALLFGCSQKQNPKQVSNDDEKHLNVEKIMKEHQVKSIAVKDENTDEEKAASANEENAEEVETVETKKADIDNEVAEEEIVVVTLDEFGRYDPFEPYTEKSIVLDPDTGIVPVPPELNTEPDLMNLMTTKVNGILYDKTNASAIISINDSDYLVRKGDKLLNYEIKDITLEKVIIKSNNNYFSAGIGEIVTGNLNDIEFSDSKLNPEVKEIKKNVPLEEEIESYANYIEIIELDTNEI